MQRAIIAFFLFIVVAHLHAQRVDLDKFNFSVAYRSFPDEPLPHNYKTFNARIEASPSLGMGFEIRNIESLVNIEGLKRVPGTGHITILTMFDDILIEKSNTTERVEIKKDKQGVETKKLYYSNELTYSFSARVSVYDYKGNTIMGNYVLYDRDQKRTYKTPEFPSPEEASGYYNAKIIDIRNTISRQLVTSSIASLNGILNQKYGYIVQMSNDLLWILNNKKHPEYKAQQKAWNQFRDAIVLVNAKEPLDKAKQKLAPVIDYFERAKSKYATSGKDDRKLRYVSYFNLAKIYLYLDEPYKAIQEADALAMNDYDESDGRYLRSAAENLAATLQKNNATTRHFAINTESYEPPIQ